MQDNAKDQYFGRLALQISWVLQKGRDGKISSILTLGWSFR